ncbi:unnamed protein product [Ilex paraguariensis]|uniref:Uncharacterized protein n=1 Tax=Ilex paraguariensis TaxID=185542 RepID=A0ABC8RUT6_9AQUA
MLEDGSGVSGTTDIGKKKILLLKGKEKEISPVGGMGGMFTCSMCGGGEYMVSCDWCEDHRRILVGRFGMLNSKAPAIDKVYGGASSATSSVKSSVVSTALKHNQRRETSGRIIRSILLNKDAQQTHSSSVVHSEHPTSNQEKDKRPPRPPNVHLFLKDTNGTPEDKGIDLHGFSKEKQEKRTRNKDRPDRGVWTPLRRSDGSHASDESLSSSTSQSTQLPQDSTEGSRNMVSSR